MSDNLMLMCGGNIRSNSDKLMKVTVQYLADKLKNPKSEVEMKVRQLRNMRMIDEKGYRSHKTELPYIVNGMFNPPVRRSENFGYIESFIIDLDHLHDKDMGIVSLKNMLSQDMMVVLAFVSPSEDGLKVLFRLKERICDAGVFKVFYKEFAQKFASKYNLSQVLDTVTCDVTRACFLSIDPDVYYNPDAEPVDYHAYIDTQNPLQMFDMLKGSGKSKEASGECKEDSGKYKEDGGKCKEDSGKRKDAHDPDPDDETMALIREQLDFKKAKLVKPKREWVVPEVLDEILPKIQEALQSSNIELTEAQNIQYGKKLKCRLGLKLAEVNLYKGKAGFSVVATPKSGTNPDLNAIVSDIVRLVIATN